MIIFRRFNDNHIFIAGQTFAARLLHIMMMVFVFVFVAVCFYVASSTEKFVLAVSISVLKK
jgi:hypothetical protein